MAKILLAEDDLFLRDIYKEILEDGGFDLTTAADGQEALTKLQKGGWDLALLDIVMPKLSGIDVLKELKKQAPKVFAKHIVLMTNSDEIDGVEEVSDMFEESILKSMYAPDKLVLKIKSILAK